eukprot:gb/GEZN01005448.1/.p1 GENE.gb/GEZN01005448.1/~~gb/GEZN01005448.1/.p1  ORF type:complete len:380 (+),score=75.41 gb/GEZN01005448.1/:96-1235(+)
MASILPALGDPARLVSPSTSQSNLFSDVSTGSGSSSPNPSHKHVIEDEERVHNSRLKKRQKTDTSHDELELAYGASPSSTPVGTPTLLSQESVPFFSLGRQRLVDLSLQQLATFYEGEEQARKLAAYYGTEQFKEICDKVFNQVDRDRSNTLDKGELLEAFKIVMERIPTSAKIVKFGLHQPAEAIHKLGESFVKQTWDSLDVDGSGHLDREEFIVAMQILWTEAVKVQTRAHQPAKLVDSALASLYKRFPKGKVAQLEQHFSSKEFKESCVTVFHEVDKGKNRRLDKFQTLAAFKLVCANLRGVKLMLGPNFDDLTTREGAQIIRNCFAALDSDGSGFLELAEFKRAMQIFFMDAFYLVETSRHQQKEKEKEKDDFMQ